MSFLTSRLLLDLLAVFLAGVTIKLLDDFLDYAIDIASGSPSLVDALGAGSVVYSLVFAVFACSINLKLAAPLILSAYAVGMLKDPSEMLPLGLSAWIESVIVLIASWGIFGWAQTLVSLLLMTAVDFVDDIIDYSRDTTGPSTNLVRVIGKTQLVLLSLAIVVAALIIDARTTALVAVCAPVTAVMADFISSTYRGKADGD
ncbi:MAG: hypothetical protein QM391_02250 [Bacillota bacterium]|jgi:hypothetical protein|nr:hypothetical protein [Bacillota bacterium]MDI9414862.1 hypothetical protein [Bacillota bacterium]NLD13083.1 hypothetical protein [Bacillota bacterium]HAV21095.1 hypothetical protein [Bacillota bacterium]HCD41598.1 hypothetical protein [Bacillota bacterium]